jgi:hypothetical protein
MLSKLFNSSSRDKHEQFVKYMVGIYGACPACGSSSADHEVWELASARPAAHESRSAILEDAIVRRDWLVATTIREFRGNEDAVAYLFLRCPKSSSIVLLRLESFSDMWADDRVTDRWVLSGDDLERARQAAVGQWRRVGEQGTRPNV